LISQFANSTYYHFSSTRQYLTSLLFKFFHQFLILAVFEKRIYFNSDLIHILLELNYLLESLECNLTGFKNLFASYKKFNTVIYCDLLIFLWYYFK
jgi:hypothetical protein